VAEWTGKTTSTVATQVASGITGNVPSHLSYRTNFKELGDPEEEDAEKMSNSS